MHAVLQLFRSMGAQRLFIILGTMIAFLSASFFIISKYAERQMIILYSNLEIEDSNRIIKELEQKNIEYKLNAGGTEILVPDNQVLRMRMELAQEGLPGRGSMVGYEIFDKADSLSVSNFVQNIHLVRALEGELARTIGSFEQVRKARVHIVLPKRELFSKEIQQPTASVVVEMKGAKTFNKAEVDAIAHLISAAVPGLDSRKITIVDTKGKSLKISESDDDEITVWMSQSQEYKASIENRLKKIIEDLLEKTVGVGSVEAQITAELNFDRTVSNSELFDPNGQVVRSTQTIEEKEQDSQQGGNGSNVSVTQNLPGGQQTGQNTNSETTNNSKTDETVNYEISKTVKNFIGETGTIKKLSIAVLVDGIYDKNKTTGEIIYTPRSEEDLKKIEALVKSAVAYNKDRGDSIEVVNMKFKSLIEDTEIPQETIMSVLKEKLNEHAYDIVKVIIIGLVLITSLLVFIKPFINKVFETAISTIQASVDAEIAIAQAEVEKANIRAQAEKEARAVEIESSTESVKIKRNNTFKSTNDIVEQCPQETLMILRNWLNS